MHDRARVLGTHVFAPFPDWAHARLEGGGLELSLVEGLSQVLVSGALEAALADFALPGPAVGALARVEETPFALRIGPDSALLVSAAPLAFESGWQPSGYAASALTGGLLVFELAGPGLPTLLARATTLDMRSPGPSAAVFFAEVRAFLYRWRREDCIRLHLERPLAPYLWRWLERELAKAGGGGA